MTQIALNDAQSRLPDIIGAVTEGEEYIITLDGKPVVKMTSVVEEMPRPIFGSSRGKFEMADDFDAPLEDFAEYM